MRTFRHWAAAAALAFAATLVGVGAEPQNPPAAGGGRQFTGTPIDVNYQGANLRAVLNELADIGGVNLFIDASVPSNLTVDLKFRQVPWDEVLATVLQSGQLTSLQAGTVVRVMTREARLRELDEEGKQRKAGEAVPDLQTMQMRLSYATAASIQKLLMEAKLKSDRGTVSFEERTNMLIVTDLQRNIDEIVKLVAELDKPEAQVEIEAKIIRTNSDTARALGLKWGFNGRAAPELGNTSGLAFPNRGTAGGRVGDTTQGPNDPRATPLERNATAVNLGAPGATSALGISLGAINGALGLDMEISALAHEGKATILSTPRVTTQNNKMAEITRGFQVPIQMVTNNTITVTFKDAALKLLVTPQITGASTVIMKITLENGTPDFSRSVNGNPSINTQRADTQVQVPDGVTTVIGGIVESQETINTDSTPGVARIPLLGKLFKRVDKRSEQQELIIFITPRIIR